MVSVRPRRFIQTRKPPTGTADFGSGLVHTRDPIGYPEYSKILVYIRYIWVFEYIFGITNFFRSFGFWFSNIVSVKFYILLNIIQVFE